jgi:superfamily II DNA/RNA helicase
MSNTEMLEATEETVEPKRSGYVVLREITTLDELASHLEKQDVTVFAVVGDVDAKDRRGAIREFAVGDTDVTEGAYVAVPMSSWKIHRVRTVIQLSLEED